MYLYNFTLKPSSVPLGSLIGQFDASNVNKQQLVIITSNTLEVWTQGADRLDKVTQQFSFGIIQKIDKLRPIGYNYDLLVVTSDSGNLTVAKMNQERQFESIIEEPHSKNGLRSITPGEYLAIDPMNRAIMIGAVERTKFVYRVHVEDGIPKLSSPLESYNHGLITIDTCAIDTEYNNPLFAALEIEPGQKTVLNYYELDQGLNHIVKTQNRGIDSSANLLIPLKPSLLICCEGFITIKVNNSDVEETLNVPCRDTNTPSIIVNYIIHKLKNDYFILLQNQFGDLFKVDSSLESIDYFGTIPPCKNINIFKNGFVYASAINHNKLYFQIIDLQTSKDISNDLENLELIQTIETLDPILDTQFNNESKLLTVSTGNIKSLTHALPTTTIVESPLPITPHNIYTTKLSQDSINDDYLVISSSSTLVLSIGEVVEQVQDSKFSDDPTVLVQQVGKNAVIQVYVNGIKHINNSTDKKVTDWYPPAGITIIRGSSNSKQLVIGLSNHEVVYFEIDADDQLIEYQDKLEMSTTITAIGISDSFAVIGCADETIQVISLQHHNCLEVMTLQALSSNSTSIQFFKGEVHIGMDNGLYVRTSIDIKGRLSNTRVKYLGSRSVKLSVLNDDSILAVSSQSWIGFIHQKNFRIVPLNDIDITGGTSFYSEDIGGEGVVGFKGDNLVIFTVDELINDFMIEDLPLDVKNSQNKLLIHDKDSYFLGQKLVKNGDLTIHDFGDERPISIAHVTFDGDHERNGGGKDSYIVVGTTTFTTEKPLYNLYCFKNNKFLHKTQIDKLPRTMVEFQGKLLVGMENYLRIYDLGLKQLLRKSTSLIEISGNITKLVYQGKKRIVIGDAINSTIVVHYNESENLFTVVSQDSIKRQVTSLSTLDYNTIVGGDKFGNIFINRVISDNDSTDNYLQGAPNRMKTLAETFINDIPMKFLKGVLILGGKEVIIYSGLQGTIGILLPISNKEYEYLKNLQLSLQPYPRLLGKDHMKFRSYYNLSKNIVDGDLIENFIQLPVKEKIRISNKINKSIKEIENKINDLRDTSAF